MMNDKRFLGGAAAVAIVAALGGFGIARWTASEPAATEAASGNTAAPKEEKKNPDTVAMTAQAVQQAGIAVETINPSGLGAEIVAQATVSASPQGEAIVTARAGGAVTRLMKRLGDPVRAGETLAVVESRDAAQFAADRTAAAAKSTLAQKALAREQYLFRQKVSARVELEQAEAEAASAVAEARRASVAAGAARVTSDGRGVLVSSPISGRVTSENVSLGAFVQPETELMRVADASKIQVEAAVGPTDAQRLSPGDRAIIELPDGRTVEARVRAVTPGLANDTRSATAVLDVTGSLQPGLAVRVRLLPSGGGTTSNAIVVPEDAVQTLEGRDIVFVRTARGFKAQTITIGQRSNGRVEILKGLAAGSQVATKNAFLLKAELGKGAGEEE
ncbi:cobalt-zinc-cadmium efflux system membrane fusion protein [Sphingomonas sp. BE270]|jgi:cobalt-zinc-cadmium efflux system membrane fusion protein|uniref:Efflux RND transporter periplasmic adaptor subunit n=3 Tax=Pseudomonadota TaxID=1224 RepID=A0ABU4PJ38_9SPHN|nr:MULTISPECIES: efflux RND transporter periplasmic adaptor subunit [Sphingomonas]MBX9776083.1 efflux RND transporter periplasmic adaptor subunit [Xanthobacteraceae bacterium]MDR6848926.1 cobalt-zinc-cadmium efflux system membrane fusion protein [Sphingomonas sp. BE137]MDR7259977.1 cobalt-zinc-cadmium efflux system membrane fusion protein [Sphingomonas sp. BE270]MDX5983167.1 efflux RND transporter periplasmic adaptor subunit [Sphingomonas echinoides]